MKRFRGIMSMVLSLALVLSGCNLANGNENASVAENKAIVQSTEQTKESQNREDANLEEQIAVEMSQPADNNEKKTIADNESIPEYKSLNDPGLIQYIEEAVYMGLIDELSSEDCVVENVQAIYYSKEYLQEVAYNSKANIWFGYDLEGLNEQFQGERFVFTLSDDGKTIVTAFEDYDDTYDKVIKNVAIGTGVILVCVTVSVISAGVGAVPVSIIFAASAKSGTIMAMSSGGIGAAAGAIITGFQTKDKDQIRKAAVLQGSESFKWSAILGAISGGVTEASTLRRAAKVAKVAETADKDIIIGEDLPWWRQAELRALNDYGGKEQVSYLAGQEVPFGTSGATRPDVVRMVGDHLEAIEVKAYNLESQASLNTLYSELEREVTSRVANLPANATQRVVLDMTGRSFSNETISTVVETIQTKLFGIYGSNIPIDIVGLGL